LLRDGENVMIALWHSGVLELSDTGKPVEIVWDQAQIDQACWVVAKGTPRRDLAMRYLESVLKPDRLEGLAAQGIAAGDTVPLNSAAEASHIIA
jgi:putative spermidine/putrescine transport system substrate-binding protein